jgi:hypothetical protein
MAEINSLPSLLAQDLATQLNKCPSGLKDKFPASPLTDESVTRKSSNLMHSIIGGEDNPNVLEAKWLHSVWTRVNA